MGFVLKIFFSGLIAFLPSADGKELTVLLVNSRHHVLADGTAMPHHLPLLLARAGSCENACVTDDHTAIAQFLFSNKTQQQAVSALNTAIVGGGAWKLAGSELSLAGPEEPLALRTGVRQVVDGVMSPVPHSPQEREDFTWVAQLSAVAPGSGGFKSSLTASDEPPPGCVIAARLRLRSGKVFTYSLVKIDGKARPVHFRKPSGDGPEAAYAQAMANWVAAEIHVPGDTVEVVDQNFDDSSRHRSMKLHPQDGVVELAILNLPPYETPAPDAVPLPPQPGQHFQIFYDLAKSPAPPADRLVPHLAASPSASDPQEDWNMLHPRDAQWSNLLEGLTLNPRGKKGPYDMALCPMLRP
jgi:hypothetical protein